jgi:hypothetical protein
MAASARPVTAITSDFGANLGTVSPSASMTSTADLGAASPSGFDDVDGRPRRGKSQML